jgi:hypothetical protein
MNWSRIKQELLGPATGWRWPFYWTLLLYISFFWGAFLGLDQPFGGYNTVLDLGADLALAFLVFWMSRRVWPFALFMLLYFTIFYGGSAMLILMLGRPILPEEIHNLRSLIMILGPLGWFGIGLPLVIFLGSLLLNLHVSHVRARLAAGAVLLIGCGVVFAPLSAVRAVDNIVGNTPWSQIQNFYSRGATLNLMQETMRMFAERTPPPTQQDVDAAVRRVRAAAAGTAELVPVGHRRNVHMLLLESFWNPDVLAAAKFNAATFDPRFMELWRQSGFTQALSPAFGGQTANAEFEVLCGFPVNQHAANFEYGVKRDVPCLPGFLRDRGYRSVASHPNEATFWNRKSVYERIGFETFWAAESLDMNISDPREVGYFMTDRRLFQQVEAKLAATRDDRPLFNYVLTIEGHWDYAAGPTRQSGTRSQSKIADVGNYANIIHFKSREVMDIITTLLHQDPDALIIAFGDHLPLLGQGFEAYVESGLLPETYDGFTKENFDFSARTPLIVIDGRNGPLNLGVLPMYQMPRVIARLVGEGGPSIFDLAATPSVATPRPLPEGDIAYVDGKPAELCRADPPSPLCKATREWLRDVKLLDHDLFRGDQYALKLLGLMPSLAQSSD